MTILLSQATTSGAKIAVGSIKTHITHLSFINTSFITTAKYLIRAQSETKILCLESPCLIESQ